jgi:hypothetical protein
VAGDGRRTDGRCDVVVEVGCGDEADKEAALADARVPDEEDLEGALMPAAAAPGPRRPHPPFGFRPQLTPRIPPDSVVAKRRGEECGAPRRHAGGVAEG